MATKRITEKLAERISPPQNGRIEIYDDLISGFCFRVTQKGKKTWSVVYRLNGKQKRYTFSKYPLTLASVARDKAREVLLLVEKGIDPAATVKKAKIIKENTFANVADQFIEKYAKLHTRSWNNTKNTFDLHVKPVWGERAINEITRKDVVELLDKLMEKGIPYGARNTFAAVRKLFNWAAERSLVETSPCLHIQAPNKTVSRDRVLSDNEVKALWAATELERYPFGNLMRFLLTTGQRLNEAAQMKWCEVDFESKLWCIPRERVKSDRAQEVPLSNLAIEILKSCPRFTGDYVFTTTEGKRPFSGFSKAKARIVIRSEVTQWRIHDLRRTAGTGMAKIGVPVAVISRVLNHAQSGVTAIYNRHTYLPEKREALEKWAKKVEGIVNG